MNNLQLSIIGMGLGFIAGMTNAAPVFEPAGMKVVWKSLDKEFDGFKTYNGDEGVYVTLFAKETEKKFVGFTKDNSKVVFKDGGKDLGGKFGFWDKISKDGSTMKLEMQSEKLPAADATSVKVEGEVEIILASQVKTLTVDAREFKKGDKLELEHGMGCSIESYGKPKWGDNPLQIEFKWQRKTPGKVPELKEVRFYDESGELIKSSAAGTTWGGSNNNYTTTKSFGIKKSVKKLKIEMDVWSDAETIKVPLDVKVQIGGKG